MRRVLLLSVPLAVVVGKIKNGVRTEHFEKTTRDTIGEIEVHSNTGDLPPMSDLRKLLEEYLTNPHPVHEALSKLTESVKKVCVHPTVDSGCYTSLMKYVYLSSGLMKRGEDIGAGQPPLCDLLTMRYIRDQMKRSIQVLATEREFDIPSEITFPMVHLPRLCDITRDKGLRMAVLYNRIYEHATDKRSWNTQESFDYHPAIDLRVESVINENDELIQAGSLFDKVRIDINGRIDRTTYHQWREWMTLGLIDIFFNGDSTELTLKPERRGNLSDLHFIYYAKVLGQFLALSLLEQTPLGVRFSQGMCRMLLQSPNEDDLRIRNVDLYNEYKSFEQSVFTGETRYFVSLIDPTRELVDDGRKMRVRPDNFVYWSVSAIAEIVYDQNDVVHTYILMGFGKILPEYVFRDDVVSPGELCDLFHGQKRISTPQFIDRLVLPKDVDPELSGWFSDVLEERGEDYRMDILAKARASPAGPFAPLIQVQVSEVAFGDPVHMVIGIPTRIIQSRSELVTALDGVEVLDTGDRVSRYEYTHDSIAAPSPPPGSRFADDPFDHREGLRELYYRMKDSEYSWFSKLLSMFTAASQAAFESLNPTGMLRAISDCERSSDHTIEYCEQTGLRFTLLLTELASRATKSGEKPVSTFLSLHLRRLYGTPYMGNRIAKNAVEWLLARDYFSPVRSVDIPPLHILMERFPLVNLPYVNLESYQLNLRLAVARDRMHRHIETHPMDRIMWEIATDDLISETLSRIALADPLHLLNKIHIQYRGGDRRVLWGARAYIEWLSDLYMQVFTDGFLFEPAAQSEKKIVRMNPSRSKDPTFSSHYRAVGRLLALSLIDEIPIGFTLPIALVKLVLNGRSSDEKRANIWNPMQDFSLTDADAYNRYIEIPRAVVAGDANHAFISLTGLPIPGHSPTELLRRFNIRSWQSLVVVDYLYLQHKIGYDAIVDGFYDILPDGIFDGVFTTYDVIKLFRGTDIGGPLDPGSCGILMYTIRSESIGTQEKFRSLVTGMNALPIVWSRPMYTCSEIDDGPLTIDRINHSIKYPAAISYAAAIEELGIPHAGSDVWDKLTEISRLFFAHPSPRIGIEVWRKLVADAGDHDIYSIKILGKVFQSDLGSFEEFGGLELLSRILAGEGAEDALVTILFILSEWPPILRNTDAEPIDPLIMEFVEREICPKLVSESFLNSLTERATRQLHYRENMGGVFHEFEGTARTDYPLARLPTVCRMPPNSLVRRTVVDDRIGRSLYAYFFPEEYVLKIPYEFEINAVLDEIARISSEKFACRIRVVYPANESQAAGAGVYRNWISRMFERSLTVFFDREQTGTFRISRTTDFQTAIPRFRAIGRLLASTILDSVPTGQRLNHGLYRFLIYGPEYVWTGQDLKRDDPSAFRSWTDTIHAYRNGENLYMSYVSLDGEDVFTGNADTELNSGNIDDWATAALTYHMFGRYRAAYEAIRMGFSETLGSEPSLIFDDAMEVEDLRSTIEGEYEVSTDQIMYEMVFQGFSRDEENRLRLWLQQLLHEGGNQFRVNFLTFVTGWKSIPIGGFHAGRSITVSRIGDARIDYLPQAHTCFMQIDLPAYPTYEIMKQKLELAVPETQLLSY
jgi:hypothetical protein